MHCDLYSQYIVCQKVQNQGTEILDRDSIWLILAIDDDQNTTLFLCSVVHITSLLILSTYYTHFTIYIFFFLKNIIYYF